MGNTKSSIKNSISVTSSVISETIINNVTTCDVRSVTDQSIKLVLGDNANISFTDIKFDASVDSKLTCLMTATLNSTELTDIKNSITQSIDQKTDVFPKLQVNDNRSMDIKQEYMTYIKNHLDINNILKSFQENRIKQAIDLQAGNSSTIVFKGITFESSISTFTDIVANDVMELTKSFLTETVASSDMTLEEKNSATEMIEHLGDNIADVAKTGISTAGNAAMISMIVFMFIAIALIIMAPKLLASGINTSTSPIKKGIDTFLMTDYIKQIPVMVDGVQSKDAEGKPIMESIPGRKLSNNAKMAIGALVTLMIGLILVMALA